MQIKEIILQTHLINELKEFYTKVLELPLVKESGSEFTVKAGSSEISFRKSAENENPFYHFAFNIPENQLQLAKEWISEKTELITLHGEDEFNFESWNAHSIYFYDPAGNILEFIARHNLKNSSGNIFSGNSLLSISEIGIPVFNIKDFYNKLYQAFPVQLFSGDTESFAALGDDNGLFIVVNKGRKWYPDCPDAEIFPMTVKLNSNEESDIQFKEINCKIVFCTN